MIGPLQASNFGAWSNLTLRDDRDRFRFGCSNDDWLLFFGWFDGSAASPAVFLGGLVCPSFDIVAITVERAVARVGGTAR